MAAHEKFLATLGRLFEATSAKQLAWKETTQEGVYRASFKQATIEVGRFQDEDEESGNSFDYLQARLYNKNNAVVEEITGSLNKANMTEPSRLLRELFDAARDSALRPEDLLKSIEDELSAARQRR